MRPRLANEWFAELSDAPGLDLVAIRQIEPGARIRISFTLPLSPCREWLGEAATTEAGAHTLFDLTQQGEREVFVVDHATLLDDLDPIAHAMTGRVARPPFETTPIFMPGFEGGTCPLFVIKRHTEGVLDLLTALPCKNDETFFWVVSGFAAGHEDIVNAYMIALLAAIDARNLKPIGPPR